METRMKLIKNILLLFSTLPLLMMPSIGYDGVNYGMGSQNFGGGYQGYQGGFNSMPYGGASPYGNRGYPTSYSNFRLYNTPVNTFPLGGIGTVGAYGGGGKI